MKQTSRQLRRIVLEDDKTHWSSVKSMRDYATMYCDKYNQIFFEEQGIENELLVIQFWMLFFAEFFESEQ